MPMEQTDQLEIQIEISEWLKRITQWKKVKQEILPLIDSGIRELENFLKTIRNELDKCDNVEESLQKFPKIGQLLGHLCSLQVLLSDEFLCKALFECITWFYVSNPVSAMQRKSSAWAISQIRGMTSQSKVVLQKIPLIMTGVTQAQFNNMVLEETERVLETIPESRTFISQSQGFIDSTFSQSKKLIQWIKFCMGLQNNQWFRGIMPKLLQILITTTNATNTETEILLSGLAQTQIGAYTGEFTVDLSQEVLHILWNNYSPSLEQEVLSLLEYLCQLPNIDDHVVATLLEFRGLDKACQKSPYVQGTVLAIVKQLQMEGADFALKNGLDKLEQAIKNQRTSQ